MRDDTEPLKDEVVSDGGGIIGSSRSVDYATDTDRLLVPSPKIEKKRIGIFKRVPAVPVKSTSLHGPNGFLAEKKHVLKTSGETNKPLIHLANASVISCIINLCNTILGAGMLGLPGAFAETGMILGILLLVIAALFSANGLRLLSLSAEKVGFRSDKPSSFYVVAKAAVPRFTLLIDFAVAIKCFGVAASYFVTVGDAMVDACRYLLQHFARENALMDALFTSRIFWMFCGLLFVIPLSFFKTLDALKTTSALSVAFTVILGVGVVAYAEGVFDPCEVVHSAIVTVTDDAGTNLMPKSGTASSESLSTVVAENVSRLLQNFSGDGNCRGNIVSAVDSSSALKSTLKNMTIFIFSFTCHQNIFSIVSEMKDRTQTKINMMITASIGTSLIVYLVVAIEGYRTYGDKALGDILLSYPQTALVTSMRVIISIMVLLTYPLQLDPSRRCVISLIHNYTDRREVRDEQQQVEEVRAVTDDSFIAPDKRLLPAGDPEEKPAEQVLFNGITCIFLLLSFLLSTGVKDLSVILAVVGATGSTIVSYVLPGIIYIKLHPEFTFVKSLAWVQLLMGCLVIPNALYFIFFG